MADSQDCAADAAAGNLARLKGHGLNVRPSVQAHDTRVDPELPIPPRGNTSLTDGMRSVNPSRRHSSSLQPQI